jgi:Exonuclease
VAPVTTAVAGPRRKPRRPPADFGPLQVLRHTGLAAWQWDAAAAAELIPPPDRDGRWSRTVADSIAARLEEIVAAVGTEPPVGGHRAADRVAGRTGLAVEKPDIEVLAATGALAAAGFYKGWPLWGCQDLDALGTDQVAAVVAERRAWVAASVSERDAPEYLGWHRAELARVARERGLRLGRLGRYARAGLDALAGDDDLAERLRADRLLMAHQAAAHLEVRETDFRYLVAGELAVPHAHTAVRVSRYRWVDVPLYRTGDLDALREHPGIDWEAARAVKPGEPSPLRHLARRPVDRAATIRRWVAEYGDRHSVEVWAWFHPGTGDWEVDFERVDGGPTVKDVKAAIAGHRYLREYPIAVATAAGAAIRWARAMREPGRAVILDTETTDLDGYVVEVAVLDAATGATLLDTLVSPGCHISDGARAVHGISDADVAGAPPWAQVLPQVLAVTAGRTVLAYNAAFDSDVIARHAYRDGLELGHLGDDGRWACLMGRRSAWELRYRWLPLGGGHRARGDCQTAWELLCAMTAPARQPKAVTRR